MAEFSDRWLADCAGQWKPATQISHRQGVRVHILPRLGKNPVAALTRDDVVDWFASLPCAPGGRNRALAVLSGMMRHAELMGLRVPGSNPCAGMRRKQSGFTATVLRAKDYARFGRALDARAEAAPLLIALIRFLALTGCRRGEAEGLRWDWIDGPRAALPDAKAGPRSIWLGTHALDLLASLPRTGDLVFGQDGKPVSTALLNKLWHEFRTEIGIPKLRLHDLRHSFATTAVSAGEPLRTVAGLCVATAT
ncbi:MAG TPA: tyrosine-type recombinase/integrase [Paenirhodobacter sp.]